MPRRRADVPVRLAARTRSVGFSPHVRTTRLSFLARAARAPTACGRLGTIRAASRHLALELASDVLGLLDPRRQRLQLVALSANSGDFLSSFAMRVVRLVALRLPPLELLDVGPPRVDRGGEVVALEAGGGRRRAESERRAHLIEVLRDVARIEHTPGFSRSLHARQQPRRAAPHSKMGSLLALPARSAARKRRAGGGQALAPPGCAARTGGCRRAGSSRPRSAYRCGAVTVKVFFAPSSAGRDDGELLAAA